MKCILYSVDRRSRHEPGNAVQGGVASLKTRKIVNFCEEGKQVCIHVLGVAKKL